MNRILSLILAFCMMLSLGVYAFAEDDPGFVKIGLADRVIDISDASEETFEYITTDKAGGSTEVLTDLTVNWATADGWGGEKYAMYRPEEAKPVSISRSNELGQAFTEIQNTTGEGYEWRCAAIKVDGKDAPHWSYWIGISDFFDPDTWEESEQPLTSSSRVPYSVHTITNDGEEVSCFVIQLYIGSYPNTGTMYLLCYAPSGYEGLVATVMSAKANSPSTWPEGAHFYDYVDEHSLFFRLR